MPEAARSSTDEVGRRRARAGGGCSRWWAIRSTWWRPWPGGMVRSHLVVEQDGPDPVAAAGEQLREGGATSASTRSFWRSTGPNAIDGERSSSSHAVTSRSSVYCAHVGAVHARGHVPVDVAQVVARLVLAQVGEVDAGAAEQRAVVALQPAVEAPDAPATRGGAGPARGSAPRCCHGRSPSGRAALAQRDVGHAGRRRGRGLEQRRPARRRRPAPRRTARSRWRSTSQRQVADVRRQGVVPPAEEGQRLGGRAPG